MTFRTESYVGNTLRLLDSCADHAVQQLNGIRRVDGLADIRRIAEESIQVSPVRVLAFIYLRVFVILGICEAVQCHQGCLLHRRSCSAGRQSFTFAANTRAGTRQVEGSAHRLSPRMMALVLVVWSVRVATLNLC